MAKLSRAAMAAHNKAVDLLQLDSLTFDQRLFVLENWQESAQHMNAAAGAFFTPMGLAYDLGIEVDGGVMDSGSVIDLCAGIGALAFAIWARSRHHNPRIVCVESNPAYVEVGRKVLPEAQWICADVFNMPALGHFTFAIGNPPFGRQPGIKAPRFTGANADLAVIDIASDIADFGAFIVPQQSAPFQFSGRQCYERRSTPVSDKFAAQTLIELEAGCGVDCDYHKADWRGVAPTVEIVCADFMDSRAARAAALGANRPPVAAGLDLFSIAAA